MVQNMKILLDFKNDALEAEINEYVTSNNLTVLKVFDTFEKLYVVEAEALPVKTDLIENIIVDSSILISPLISTTIIKKTEDNDWWKYASLDDTNNGAEEVTVTRSGQDAIVYVVDSGIETTHSEFDGKTITNLFTFNGDTTDYNGHGTAIASLLCGKTCSLSDTEVKSVKIFQTGVDTNVLDLVYALEEVGKDILATPDKFHIVNMSWGISKNEWIESKIRELILKNAIVVAAAGNSGTSIENITPAGMPEVFTVGAYDSNFASCNFTNYSGSISNSANQVNTGELNAWAPGQDIMVAVPGGTYGLAGGTSLAAAIHSSALSFNSKNLVNFDGILPTDHQILNFISVGKKNFLALDDQYSTAQNIMTTFFTSYAGVLAPIENGFVVEIVVANGKYFETVLLPNNILKSILAVSELPNGVTTNGILLQGSITVDQTSTTIYDMQGIDYGNNTVYFKLQITVDVNSSTPTVVGNVLDINQFIWDSVSGDESKN